MDSPDLNKLTIFTEPDCLFSHQVRLVLHEKDIEAIVIEQSPHLWPEDVLAANPYGRGPTLVSRELTLFNAQVITDYLDERYPHPALFASDPVTRAKQRLMRYRIEQDWYPVIEKIRCAEAKTARNLLKQIIEDLTVLSPLFEHTAFCSYDDFSILDCALAPILWHIKQIDATLPSSASAITRYQQRLFKRPCFQTSLQSAKQGLITP